MRGVAERLLEAVAQSEDVALSVGAALKGVRHRIAWRSALCEHDLVVHPTAGGVCAGHDPSMNCWP